VRGRRVGFPRNINAIIWFVLSKTREEITDFCTSVTQVECGRRKGQTVVKLLARR
jgi:hypothetical protein